MMHVFKNMLKRAWLSAIRKMSRSLILLVILFVMANMLFATFAINKSVSNSMDFAKEQLGGTVYLSGDMEYLRELAMKAREGGETDVDLSSPTITREMVEQIGDSNFLKDYTYTTSASANSSSFKTVTTAANERERQYQDALKNAQDQAGQAQQDFNRARDNFNRQQTQGGGQDSGRVIMDGQSRPIGGGAPFSFRLNLDIADPSLGRGDTTVTGINNWEYVSGVSTGEVAMLEGNADSAIISSEVASENDISVGDEIKLKTMDDEEISLIVSGIYKATDENFDYNTVYVDWEKVQEFTDSNIASNVRFYLTSASQKDAFLAEVVSKGIDITGLKLDVDDSSYQQMVRPIENVGSFSRIIMWIIIIASLLIITLIVAINVKDRRYEMGVLMSLGARRTNILAQIFVELAIVATLAFAISVPTAGVVAAKMGDVLITQQIEQVAEEQEQQAPRGGMMMRVPNQQEVKPIDKIDVSSGLDEYAWLFGSGYLILLFAMVIPSVNILRYQPKTILTGKE